MGEGGGLKLRPEADRLQPMDTNSVIAVLKHHKDDLRRQGVAHASVFGSMARGESRPDSDIDIVVDIDPSAALSAFDYAGLKHYVAGLFKGPVDVVSLEGLKRRLKPSVLAEKIDAF